MACPEERSFWKKCTQGCSPHKEVEGALRNSGKILRNSKMRLPQRENHHIAPTNAVHEGQMGHDGDGGGHAL